jgi:hypothetical protein
MTGPLGDMCPMVLSGSALASLSMGTCNLGQTTQFMQRKEEIKLLLHQSGLEEIKQLGAHACIQLRWGRFIHSGTLTSTAEASQVGAATLIGELEAVVHHLGGERQRLELVAHTRLVHALHHAAALPRRRGRAGSPDGRQARVQGVGVAHPCSAGLRRHGQHHQQADAHSQSCTCHAL